MIGRLGESPAELIGKSDANFGGEAWVRVDAGANGRPANWHVFFQAFQCPTGANGCILGLGGIAGEDLPDANRRGIHQMRAADFDELVPLLSLFREVLM